MARKSRKWIYYGGTLSLVVGWYLLTGVESWRMGYNPLVRRSFTSFDAVLFVFVTLGCLFLYFRYRRSE